MKQNFFRTTAIALVMATVALTGCKDDDPVKVSGVSLNKTTLTLTEGASEKLTATVAPADAENQKTSWKSDKTDVATVDAAGNVTAVKAGAATITVTTEDGGKTAACTVTVEAATVAVTGVTLDKTTATLAPGGTVALKATVAPDGAGNKKVTWSSSKPDVATVADGTVTGVAAGEAVITVTTEDGGKTATCTVTVDAAAVAVTGVTLDKTTATLEAGQSLTLKATVAPDGATNKKVSWASDKTNIASVDQNGNVTAVAEGEAVITVTTEDGAKTATCAVTVEAAAVAVTGVSLDRTTATLEAGESLTLKATVAPDEADNKKVSWASDKTNIATVDQSGKVTAVAAGIAVITVTTEDGAKTASCSVTVEAAIDPAAPQLVSLAKTTLVKGVDDLVITGVNLGTYGRIYFQKAGSGSPMSITTSPTDGGTKVTYTAMGLSQSAFTLGEWDVWLEIDGKTSNTLRFTLTANTNPAPVVTSVSDWNPCYGTEVTVTGSNFGADAEVRLGWGGGMYAKPEIVSKTETEIVFKTDKLYASETYSSVEVTSGGQTGKLAGTFKTTECAPEYKSISPAQAKAGTKVIITGNHFITLSTVSVVIGAASAYGTPVDNHTITFTVPNAATPGAAAVTVQSINGSKVYFTIPAADFEVIE
jgi:uncharacterized protein YjdB